MSALILSPREVELYLPTPHPAQGCILHPAAAINTLATGSKFGKTVGLATWLVREALTHPDVICRWIAPIYRQAKIGFRLISRMIPVSQRQVSLSDLVIRVYNGTEIQAVSADRPDNIAGEGVFRWVFDEAAKAVEEAWEQHLTTLSAMDSVGWLASTPNGRNFFWRLACYGADETNPDYAFYTFPTFANPQIRPEVIRRAWRTLPLRTFEQLFLAAFHDNAGDTFPGYDHCVLEGVRNIPPAEGHHYIIGVDLAKHHDFTVISVIDVDLQIQVAFWRFHKYEWPITKGRILAIAERYQGEVVIDATGLGDPIYDDLLAAGMDIEGVKFNVANRRLMVQKLKVGIEQREVRFLDHAVQEHEFNSFETRLAKNGEVTYGKAPGLHDDCVWATALAWYRARGFEIAHAAQVPDDELDEERFLEGDEGHFEEGGGFGLNIGADGFDDEF